MHQPFTLIIVGGYGNFGQTICQELASYPSVVDKVIWVAGRHLDKAMQLIQITSTTTNTELKPLYFDLTADDIVDTLQALSPHLVINAAGPFQTQDYRLIEACIEIPCHYIDVADAREFVTGVTRFNQVAQAQGVSIISGASSVPGLSSAVVEKFSPNFSSIELLDYGISPGNRTDRGESTVAAILSYTGKPFLSKIGGKMQKIFGWQDCKAYFFEQSGPQPALGIRWFANCDVPDLELFPVAYPGIRTIRFRAGLELKTLHFAMRVMSSLARLGVVKNWSFFSKELTILSRWFQHFGSDEGGMYVIIRGVGLDGKPKQIRWQLVALAGDGPKIPSLPSVILAQKLIDGKRPNAGAQACMSMFSLGEFEQIAARWNIYCETVDDVSSIDKIAIQPRR